MIQFKEENITKRSDLEVSDSISAYLGHSAQQNPNAYEAFFNLIQEVKPSRIIEIGTAMGGFTLFLKMCVNDFNLDTEIISYEVDDRESYNFIRSHGIDIRIKNVFHENYTGVTQEIIDLIQNDDRCIVLCDGGHKISEFNLLSKYLKSGDIIMAHDYASTPEYFEEFIKNKQWNWLEITDNDIEDAVVLNNLQPYMKKSFDNAVWVCKIKQ